MTDRTFRRKEKFEVRLLRQLLVVTLAFPVTFAVAADPDRAQPNDRHLNWYALTLGPWIGVLPNRWGSGALNSQPEFDVGGEVAYWHYWKNLPIMVGCDLGVGNRSMYAEIQMTPSWMMPLGGVALGAVHAWEGEVDPLGFQATVRAGYMFILYARVEQYRGGNGLAEVGLMFKVPLRYTGGIPR